MSLMTRTIDRPGRRPPRSPGRYLAPLLLVLAACFNSESPTSPVPMTPEPTPTPQATPTPGGTATPTPGGTATPAPTATRTPGTGTPTPSTTPTPTPTPPPTPTPTPTPPPPTLSQLQSSIFGPRCGIPGCHTGGSPPQGLNLSSAAVTYANVVNVVSRQMAPLNRVTPNNPGGSYLVHKIEGPTNGTERMPLGGPYLSAAEMASVRAWITAGALNN